jgi:SAM-dependent methyltransferase
LCELEHRRALAGLRRINLLSRTSAVLWKQVRRLGTELNVRSLRVLDLACGGGDVGIGLVQRGRRAGLEIELCGCDLSPVAIEVARERARSAAPTAEFIVKDLLHDELPAGFDVVMCSLFLHHLDQSNAVRLLERMKQAAQRLVLVDDLLRNRLGYWMAWLGCRILSRSSIVHTDGPLSVRGAFTRSEALDLARKADLTNAVLTRHWPQRYLMTWRRP